MKILVDRYYAHIFCSLRAIARIDLFSFQCNGAGIHFIGARQDLNEGRFSRTVFAQKSMNFSFPEIEVHIFQYADPVKRLADVF